MVNKVSAFMLSAASLTITNRSLSINVILDSDTLELLSIAEFFFLDDDPFTELSTSCESLLSIDLLPLMFSLDDICDPIFFSLSLFVT